MGAELAVEDQYGFRSISVELHTSGGVFTFRRTQLTCCARIDRRSAGARPGRGSLGQSSLAGGRVLVPSGSLCPSAVLVIDMQLPATRRPH